MVKKAFVVAPGQYAPALPVVGTNVTVLADRSLTGGPEMTIQSGDEGSGPPLHSHEWDESFFVLRGKIEFDYDGTTTMCLPGTLVHVPAGVAHGFRYGPGGGEMLEFTGANSGAAAMFRDIAAMPVGSAEPEQVVAVMGQHRVKVHA